MKVAFEAPQSETAGGREPARSRVVLTVDMPITFDPTDDQLRYLSQIFGGEQLSQWLPAEAETELWNVGAVVKVSRDPDDATFTIGPVGVALLRRFGPQIGMRTDFSDG